MLGVVIASREKGQSVAWYHPVKSHSGDDAIAAFKECEFRLSLMVPPGEFKLARVHSDCEKSLIGPLCELLKARGIWPTNTEGYDHNGNAVVEARNRVLLKGLRCALSTAAGRARYTEVWGAGVVQFTSLIVSTTHLMLVNLPLFKTVVGSLLTSSPRVLVSLDVLSNSIAQLNGEMES